MVNKKTLADLGWEVHSDSDGYITFWKNGVGELFISREQKNIILPKYVLSYAELAAILDFIIEDAIY